MLLERVKAGTLSSGGNAVVLGALMTHHITEARNIVESRIPIPLPTEPTARELAETAARLLIEHAEDSGWSVVWPAIQADSTFGTAVVEGAFGGIRSAGVSQLTEDQIANLYIWLVNQYPYSEDRVVHGAIGNRDTMGHFRDGLLTHLAERGTYAA